jgi:hypothetical protein
MVFYFVFFIHNQLFIDNYLTIIVYLWYVYIKTCPIRTIIERVWFVMRDFLKLFGVLMLVLCVGNVFAQDEEEAPAAVDAVETVDAVDVVSEQPSDSKDTDTANKKTKKSKDKKVK